MTPLQVIMAGYRMRLAQKKLVDGAQTDVEVMALEKAFDEAIQPYVDYAKAEETDNVQDT